MISLSWISFSQINKNIKKKHEKTQTYYLCDWLACVEGTVYGLPFKKLNFPILFLSPHKLLQSPPFHIFTTNVSMAGPATSSPLDCDSGLQSLVDSSRMHAGPVGSTSPFQDPENGQLRRLSVRFAMDFEGGA